MSLKKIRTLNRSLVFRLTAVYALAFALIAAVGFTVIFYQLHAMAMDQMDAELIDEVEVFNALFDEEGLSVGIEKIVYEDEFEDPDEEFYRILDHDGSTLMATDMSAWKTDELQDAVRLLRGSGRNYLLQTIDLPGQDNSARVITTVIGENRILQIGETLEEVEDYLRVFQNLFGLLMVILTTVTIFVGWGLTRWSLSDMAAVTNTAEKISRGDFEHRVSVNGNLAEMERLANMFNKMLDRILGLMTSMRDINDSIAHDLRSPLARIRGIAEMTLTDDKPLADFKDMAASTIEECDELISLINTMLEITETEAGVAHIKKDKFDVIQVLKEACELFSPLAEEKEVTLVRTFAKSQFMTGDRKRMQRVVTNLLENAIKYTNAGGTVSVSAVSRGSGIDITFEDSGIGIPEKDLPHIYDRFFRGDKSRSCGGFGLGLSLARAYTESMNGRINVHSSIDKGSIFTLSFKSQTLTA
jgi:signal transduction histidine kinase